MELYLLVVDSPYPENHPQYVSSTLLEDSDHQVDIWTIDLGQQKADVQYYRELLSPDEVQRADRFYYEKHRNNFIISRAAMREIMSRYTSGSPRSVAFTY